MRLKLKVVGLRNPVRDPVARFWAFVDKSGECWLWTGATARCNYGTFNAGSGRGMVVAHRFSYETVNGSIPAGFDIDHLCRTSLCVRPDHLEAVTHRENVHRGAAPSISTYMRRLIYKTCAMGHFLGENLERWRDKQHKCLDCHADYQRQWVAKRKTS